MKFDSLTGTVVVIGFSILLIAITTILSRKKKSAESFFVGDRSLGTWIGAFTSAAAWTWAPALFVSSQVAYTKGLPGVFWFVVPNALALVMFAFLAKKTRGVMEQGYTLPEYIKHRFGAKNQILYDIAIFIVQCYAVITQILGTFLLLNLLTGLSKPFLIIVIAVVFLVIASFRGIRSSVASDVIKMVMMLFVCVFVAPFVITKAGGLSIVAGGVGGANGMLTNLFDGNIAWAYGIPTAISLLAGVTVDQQQWQRAFAIKKEKVTKAFVLAGVLFLIIPLMLSLLGFIASNPNTGIVVDDPQLAGVGAIAKYFPSIGIAIFAVMVLAALISAGSAALCAISSITAVDIYKQYFNKKSDDKKLVMVARVTMFVVLAIAVGVALIPNISILYLQLLVGSFRAALFIPTILTLFWKPLKAKPAFYGIIGGMLTGVPIFIYGSIIGNSNISTTGTLISLLLSGIICFVGSKIKNEKVQSV